MEEQNDRIDRYIKKALEVELARTPSPSFSKEDAWANIRQVLLTDERKKRRVKFYKYTKVFGVAMVATLLLFIIVFQPQVGSAFNWVKEMLLKTQGNVTELKGHIGEPAPVTESSAETDDEGEVYSVVTYEMMSLEEAQEITDFDIIMPTYIPEGYSLEGVEVAVPESGKSNEAVLHYSNGEETLSIKEMLSRDGMGFGSGVDRDDTHTKEVTVHDGEAVLFTFKDGSKKLVWEKNKLFFTLNSLDRDLQEDNLLQMANTME